MGPRQHVQEPTHESGHTLDLVITRQYETVLDSPPFTDRLFSDYLSVMCNLKTTTPTYPVKEISYKNIKSIKINSLKSDLSVSKLCIDTPKCLDNLVKRYNGTLVDIFNTHAPTKSNKVLDLWCLGLM